MPAAVLPHPRAAAMDASNEYDQAVDDFLKDLPLDNNTNFDTTAPVKNVDEEIKVRKKRAPAPKLDENLLLSETGIPRLRRISKNRLKLKGKGHEFSDMARMLSMYQLWLDDMYPKAKFRDALTMVEKVGHSKRMQVMRKGWIDASKASMRQEDVERVGGNEEDVTMSGGLGAEDAQEGDQASKDFDDMFRDGNDASTTGDTRRRKPGDGEMPDEDELDALMAENEVSDAALPRPPKSRGPFDLDDDDEPEADDLDALLDEQSNAEGAPQKPSQLAQQKGPFNHDDGHATDEDELDALLAAEPASKAPVGKLAAATAGLKTARKDDHEFADDEEAMASMGGIW